MYYLKVLIATCTYMNILYSYTLHKHVSCKPHLNKIFFHRLNIVYFVQMRIFTANLNHLPRIYVHT